MNAKYKIGDVITFKAAGGNWGLDSLNITVTVAYIIETGEGIKYGSDNYLNIPEERIYGKTRS